MLPDAGAGGRSYGRRMNEPHPSSAEFAALHDRHRHELRAHCARLMGSNEDAEDAVQETFLRAWRGRRSLRQAASARAWLYRIATNACYDALAQRQRYPVASPDEHLDGIAAVEHELEAELVAKETVELTYLAAIKHLPPRQRSVLILREVLGRSAKETATLLESTVASVNSAGQRARGTLRKHLPQRRLEWAPGVEPSDEERELLTRYLEATERGDVEAVAGAR